MCLHSCFPGKWAFGYPSGNWGPSGRGGPFVAWPPAQGSGLCYIINPWLRGAAQPPQTARLSGDSPGESAHQRPCLPLLQDQSRVDEVTVARTQSSQWLVLLFLSSFNKGPCISGPSIAQEPSLKATGQGPMQTGYTALCSAPLGLHFKELVR